MLELPLTRVSIASYIIYAFSRKQNILSQESIDYDGYICRSPWAFEACAYYHYHNNYFMEK